jgi:hypothetical protein
LRHAGRDPVEIRVEFVVGLDDRVFFFCAHIKAHDQHAHAGMADRVDVFDPRHFAQQLLHRKADALGNLLRGRARHLHKNVKHRNHDLRFLFARRFEDGECTEEEGSDDDKRSQLRIDERVSDLSCQAKRWMLVSLSGIAVSSAHP